MAGVYYIWRGRRYNVYERLYVAALLSACW